MEYRVRLEQFEGPLDLLLHLIEESELDIKDIFVSEITSQYLAYMSSPDAPDMDRASEFLSVAATLLYLKSRRLLPRPPKEAEAEEEDPEEAFIRQLREYKAFKDAGEDLRALYDGAKASLTRLPEDVPLPPKEATLDNATLEALTDAFLSVLARRQDAPETVRMQHVRPDRFTVRSQTAKIRLLLAEKKQIAFEELFSENAPRLEIIATFMALLEMIARSEILVRQKAPFQPIRIHADKLMDDDDDYEYMDETQA